MDLYAKNCIEICNDVRFIENRSKIKVKGQGQIFEIVTFLDC